MNKYKPTTLKSLFHQTIVSEIKKWISTIESLNKKKKSVKKILLLHGAVGSGKSVTIDCIFKNYNIMDIDSDTIRSVDKIREMMQTIVSFDMDTMTNFLEKNKKGKHNILFVDNIELCEKLIETFVDSVHNKYDIDIPIVLICNNLRYQEMFKTHDDCTTIEFPTPSFDELMRLSDEINKKEKLNLPKENLKQIVAKSQYDIRQLLFLLEQWSIVNCIKDNRQHNIKFNLFMESLDLKQTDIDLSDKMDYIFDKNSEFDIQNMFLLASSEPQTLSNSIYQNYVGPYNTNEIDKVAVTQNYLKIIDTLSLSNTLNSEIYENQNWELYNDYVFMSTVVPSYYTKQNKQIDNSCIVPFKDISYNFMNSYEEVKKICKQNLCSIKMNPEINVSTSFLSPDTCYMIVPMVITCIKHLNEYFEKNKRGKNTTKREKLNLCDNIDGEYKLALDKLTSVVYDYKLFEIDIDDFLINKEAYKEDTKDNINLVDLRVFKRILNIFTMDDSHKLFKSHIETSIQYNVLKRLLDTLTYTPDTDKILKNIYSVEHLTQDINDIWGFG